MRIMKEYGYMYALRLIKADYHRYSSLNKMGEAVRKPIRIVNS